MSLLHFIYHSSYLWEGEKAFLLFDYYGEGDPQRIIKAAPDKPLYILCTHSHHDHYHPSIFGAFEGREITYIFHGELRDKVPADRVAEVHFLATGERYHDDYLQVQAFGSTDEGGSFYCQAEGLTLFHAGDLNNWHWNEEASPHYIKIYEEAWHKELSHLTEVVHQLDLLMFPTDLRLGKDYLKGLRELLGEIEIRYLAPMHINGNLDPTELQQLASAEDCTLLLPDQNAPQEIR